MLGKKMLCGLGVLAAIAWFAAAQPNAQTVDQRVFFTFSGPVELPQQKERAEKVARKVKGVKQVVNNLEIKTQPAK